MSNLSQEVIIAAIAEYIGFLILSVGVFSPGWTKNIGLFLYCVQGYCMSISFYESSAYFQATVAMEIIAFIFALICIGLVTFYLIARVLDNSGQVVETVPRLVITASLISDLFAAIGCIVFAAEKSRYISLSYSFYLTIVGGTILAIGSGFFTSITNNQQVQGT